MFWGKNPWQSHGFPRARPILKEIANDPDRTLIVVDPRRTETADLADIHLQVAARRRRRPASARCSAVLVEETSSTTHFLADHANGLDELLAHLGAVDIAESCAQRRRAARTRCAHARPAHRHGPAACRSSRTSASSRRRTRTLNSYLEKLVVLLTGNFGVPGGMNLHTALRQPRRRRRSATVGARAASRPSPVTGSSPGSCRAT